MSKRKPDHIVGMRGILLGIALAIPVWGLIIFGLRWLLR